MPDVVCLGEALIDFVALESGVDVGSASGFLRAPGGAPANVAVGVARLGHTSAFLGKVGDDPFGQFLAKTFAAQGVDVGGMVFSQRHRTGLAFVSLEANGERDFCFFRNPSADMTFTSEELDRRCLTSGRIFHFGSITLIDQPARTTTLKAVEIAHKNGLLISFDPNLRPPLWPDLARARKLILTALPLVDLVKLSVEELYFLLGPTYIARKPIKQADILSLAALLFRRFPQIQLLAVTDGAAGSLWITPRADFEPVSGFSVNAVDTTGAGDGFVAAMLVKLLQHDLTDPARLAEVPGTLLTEIFQYANAVGALTTTSKGAIPALPTAAQVAHFLDMANIPSQAQFVVTS